MERHTDLLNADEYTDAIAQGRKGFVQSAVTLVIAVTLFGVALVLAVGMPKLNEPDFIELIVSGVNVLRGIVPSERVVPIVGVLATVCIAHAVSIRSMPQDVRKLQATSTSDKGKLKDAVRRASQLQSTLLASTMFSILGAALAALVTFVVMLNGDGAAAAVTGLLTLFLFFELVRLHQATGAIDDFKRSISSKDRATYRRSFNGADQQCWRSIVWYAGYLLALIVPAVMAADAGYGPMAIKVAITTTITWSFGFSVSISYVRGTVGVSVSSRLAARILSVVLFLLIWLMSVQIAIEFMSDAEVDSWAVVNTYLVAFAFTLGWACLRIWGESGWLFFRWFGAQHSAIIHAAGDSSLAGLSWSQSPRAVVGKAFLVCCLIGLPPIVFAVAEPSGTTGWYPMILLMLSIAIAATARWSVTIERIVGSSVAVLIIIATGKRGLEELDSDGALVITALIASMVIMAGTVIVIVWDRRRTFVLLRPILTILDLDFARRYRQDAAEIGRPSEKISPISHQESKRRLLAHAHGRTRGTSR